MQSIIFFDIDGTIMTEDERMIIPESTVSAIAETRRKGNLTFINSGRTAFNVSERIKSLGFDGFIYGCGTQIEYNGKVLFHNKLDHNLCRNIAESMRRCRVTPVYEDSKQYYFDDKAPLTDGLKLFFETFAANGIDISGRVEDESFQFDKFVVWDNKNCDMEAFRKEASRDFSVIDRGDDFYEMVPLGFSKATAIHYILEKLGIPLDNAYAIGDSANDLSMLEAVPNSIAMGGAERIYPYVSYVTTPIEKDGIANALKHYGLI